MSRPRPEVRRAIDAALADSDSVERLIHSRTEHLGPDEILLAAKVEFRADMDFAEVATAIDELESACAGGGPRGEALLHRARHLSVRTGLT